MSDMFTKYQKNPVGFGEDMFHETYTDDVKEVMMSVVHNQVTIAKSSNAVGKTHAAARIATWFYKCYPGAKIFTTSAPPYRNLAQLLWGEIYGLTTHHSDIFKGDRITADLNITRASEEYITGVSIPMSGRASEREAKFSGKHSPYLLFIVDEADAVPQEVFRGIESCMSGGMARLLVMFNPRAEVGMVANMIRAGDGNVITLRAFDHPNVVTGDDIYPGAVTRDKTVRRMNQWSVPLVAGEKLDEECYEVPENLVGAVAVAPDGEEYPALPAGYRRVTNPAFHYMVLGQYPPQSENQLISQAWLDQAVMRYRSYIAQYGQTPPLNITPIAGFDVADRGNDFNQLCVRYGGLVMPLHGWKGMDVDTSALRAGEYLSRLVPQKQKGSLKILVDATGVGSAVAPRLKRMGYGKAESVYVASSATEVPLDADGEPMGEFFQLRDQLWWTVREWLRTDPGAMLPPDDELLQELHTPLYRIHNGKIRIDDKDTMKELLGRSPDKADALGMTFAPKANTAGAFR